MKTLLTTTLLAVATTVSAQVQTVNQNPLDVHVSDTSIYNVPVHYYSDSQTNGTGFRIHYDSSLLEYVGMSRIYEYGFLAKQGQRIDRKDFDNDPNTDSYVSVAWAVWTGDWPKNELVKLMDLHFRPTNQFEDTQVNYTSLGVPPYFTWESNPTNFYIVEDDENISAMDIDGDGRVDAFTDGMLALRYMLGFRGQSLVDGVVHGEITDERISEIESYMESMF